MDAHDNAFWDELGVAWRATVPDEDLFRSRLERRLRLQALVLGTAISATAAATLVGLGLGAWTVWIGWSHGTWHFVVRGATLIAAALLTLVATIVLRGSRAEQSVREGLQLLITRTESLTRAVDLLVAVVATIGLGGIVGYVVRARYGRPAIVSPIEDLLALAVLALALFWFRWAQSRTLEAAKHVGRLFDPTGDQTANESASHPNRP